MNTLIIPQTSNKEIKEKEIDITELFAETNMLPESYKTLKQLFPYLSDQCIKKYEDEINLSQRIFANLGDAEPNSRFQPIFPNKEYAIKMIKQAKIKLKIA